MKFLSSLFFKLYQYSTVLVVIGTPLFFLPKTSFTPEITYYITVTILASVALFSYVVSAFITKTWQTISRLEFISYFIFSIAVILSVLFSKNPLLSFFGDFFDPSTGASLITLPVIIYLVRSLPEIVRHKLKMFMVIVLSVSSLIFVMLLMNNGSFATLAKQIFSGFSSSISFAVYLGIFGLGCLFFVFKGKILKRNKIAIGITGILFFAWALALSYQDGVRPNMTSTAIVGKNVMINEGVFGIGTGNFVRAWQLYRPQTVIDSQYFGYDFSEGSSFVTTLFVTVGIFGTLAFLILVLSSLYSVIVSYHQNKEEKEHLILGFITMVLLYFILVSLLLPLSYGMLILWMVVAGLGLGKARLTEYHPSKKIGIIMIPLACLLLLNSFVTINKVRAFSLYNKSQASTKSEDAFGYLVKAVSIYPYDGFYRVQVENLIQLNRVLVSQPATNQEALKTEYLLNSQKAVDAGMSAVKLNPGNYRNYVSLGRAYELAVPFEKEGAFDRAKKSYQEAVKLYPENPFLYVMIARLESSAGTKEGVRQSLSEALKKKQNFTDALYLMSQLEASESKVDEAIKYAIEAIKSSPNDPLTYIQAGLLFYGKKDYDKAIFALKTALEKDQNNANVAYFLALALRDSGRIDVAKQIGDELLRRNPGNPDLEVFLSSLVPKVEVVEPVKSAVKKTKK